MNPVLSNSLHTYILFNSKAQKQKLKFTEKQAGKTASFKKPKHRAFLITNIS